MDKQLFCEESYDYQDSKPNISKKNPMTTRTASQDSKPDIKYATLKQLQQPQLHPQCNTVTYPVVAWTESANHTLLPLAVQAV